MYTYPPPGSPDRQYYKFVSLERHELVMASNAVRKDFPKACRKPLRKAFRKAKDIATICCAAASAAAPPPAVRDAWPSSTIERVSLTECHHPGVINRVSPPGCHQQGDATRVSSPRRPTTCV